MGAKRRRQRGRRVTNMFELAKLNTGTGPEPPPGAFIFDDAPLKSTARTVVGDPTIWHWSAFNNWHDSNSGRLTMQIHKQVGGGRDWRMKLDVKNSGRWVLESHVHLAVHRQVWRWKLDAFDFNGKFLFSVVTPRRELTSPDFRIANHTNSDLGSVVKITQRFFPGARAADEDQVSFFLRRGVGEYFD